MGSVPPAPWQPRRRRLWHRVAALVAAALAVLVVGYGCLSLVDLMARTTSRTSRTVEAAPIIHLSLDGDSGVTIIGEERTDIHIARKVRQGLRDVHAHERVDGDELVLDSGCPIFLGTLCRVDYDLRVPIGTEVEGSTAGGHLRLTRVSRVDVSSGGGSIDLDRTTGPVDVRTGGGSIDGRRLRSARVHGRSGGGSVDVRFAVPPTAVDVSSGGGGVHVVVPEGAPPYAVDAHSGGGSTSVVIPTDPEAPRHISARSGGGSVEVRHPDG
jgi:hypothetical protein